MWELRTDEIASGSSGEWVTPTSALATGGQTSRSGARKGELLLSGQVQQSWVTPQARDGEQRGVQSMRERVAQGHSMSLPEQVKDWPTANARDWKDTGPTQGARKSPNLGTMVHHEWPTPAATPYGTSNNGCPGDGREEYATKGKPSLEGMTRLWPTATATDANSSGAAGYSTASGRHAVTTLTDATCGPRGPESSSTNGKSRARLNHRWVAQLLGFPSDWLDGIDAQP